MIFRDDDISGFTNLEDFKRVHELFNEFDTVHTIAVIAKDIERHPSLIDYIKSQNNIDVQLHCWDHVDMTEAPTSNLTVDIDMAVKTLHRVFGKKVTTLYPPWNKHDARLDEIAAVFDLKVSSKKVSFSQYIKAAGDVAEDTINFHYWAPQEMVYLQTALEIYKQRKYRCL